MLSKSKGLRPAQLGPVLTKSSHLSFACISMLFGVHLNVILGKASTPVFSKERTVSTIKDVHLRVGELWVLFGVSRAIVLSDMTSHDGCSMGRILAVEN